jgi:phage tail sheath protein FI
MAFNYQTPGVYYEHVDSDEKDISPVRMDVAGFVGIAERGPVDMPVPVESWRQFRSYFGGFTRSGFLAYTVKAFFDNGGRRCWVVRVASKMRFGASSASVELKNRAGKDIWRISASSEGVWGNNLSVMIDEKNRLQTETCPPNDAPDSSEVTNTSGFERGTLVRLYQESIEPALKVVADVDHARSRLFWVNETHDFRLRYESRLERFDPDRPIFIESVDYTLTVLASGRLIARYDGLSLVPEDSDYGPKRLAGPTVSESPGFVSIPAAPEPVMISELREITDDFRNVFLSLDDLPGTFSPLGGGVDGLSNLATYDFVGEEIYATDSDALKSDKRRGIRVLDTVEEVAVVAVPDIHIQPVDVAEKAAPEPEETDPCLTPEGMQTAMPVRRPSASEVPRGFTEDEIYQVQDALVRHCEKAGNRMALLDAPFSMSQDDEQGIGAVRAWRSRFVSKYAAFYYPWLRVANPVSSSEEITRDIPPTGHVAGQYANTDFEIGVHKAPANSPLAWVQDVTNPINEEVHGILNLIGVNVIRTLSGRGIRILGARTVSSDPSWRYVNVRRLIMMIQKAAGLSLQWASFEPNDHTTRTKVRLSLFGLLSTLWEQGALMGVAREEAFYVKCSEENNPPTERDKGRLLAEVGVAPSKPFEFVVLRVGRAGNEFEVTESQFRSGAY